MISHSVQMLFIALAMIVLMIMLVVMAVIFIFTGEYLLAGLCASITLGTFGASLSLMD